MKTVGIILLCVQVMAFLGGIANGSVNDMFTLGGRGIGQLFGFYLPGIIGIVLIIKVKKKKPE